MANILRRSLLLDLLNSAWIGLLGFGLSAYYLYGKMIDTGYPDWIYHAFRAQSISQHGLLSWDTIWDNGISYWRGYQLVPGLITALVVRLAHIGATQAMMILTVALFTVFHVVLYVALRYFGRSATISAIVAALSFAFTGYWVLVGFYSILYAVVSVPLLLMLWKAAMDGRPARLNFVIAIGLSIYVHPLLALSFGGLWAITLFLQRKTITPFQALSELVIMAMMSCFYWYGLLFIDAAYTAPYQLAKDFLYTVGAAVKFGFIYVPIAVLLLFAVTFVSQSYSAMTKYLFWYAALLFLLIEMNLNTGLVDWLNRYQIYRAGFFIGVALLVAFAEFLSVVTARLSPLVVRAMFALALGIGISQSLIDSSIYGYTPVDKVSEPVGAYLATPKNKLTGSIFINDSMPASYYHPNLHFSNGYNDQLLPQLANDRLRSLLSEVAPDYRVTPSSITLAQAYAKTLGVGSLFLPIHSPYIKPLLTQAGFTMAGEVSGQNFDLAVLIPPWKPTYGVVLPKNRADTLTGKIAYDPQDVNAYLKRLDDVVQRVAAIKDAPDVVPVDIAFPAPDKLHFTVAAASQPRYIYVSQSYSRGWQSSGGSIAKTADNMMLITVPAGVTAVSLTHTWGQLPLIQLILWGLVALYLIVAYLWGRRRARP